jgi:hypothetical protein
LKKKYRRIRIISCKHAENIVDKFRTRDKAHTYANTKERSVQKEVFALHRVCLKVSNLSDVPRKGSPHGGTSETEGPLTKG